MKEINYFCDDCGTIIPDGRRSTDRLTNSTGTVQALDICPACVQLRIEEANRKRILLFPDEVQDKVDVGGMVGMESDMNNIQGLGRRG